MLYYCLSGRLPFSQTVVVKKGLSMRGHIVKGLFVFYEPHFRGVSEEAKAIVRGLLQVDPDARLTAGGALQSPWFADVRESVRAHPHATAPQQSHPSKKRGFVETESAAGDTPSHPWAKSRTRRPLKELLSAS